MDRVMHACLVPNSPIGSGPVNPSQLPEACTAWLRADLGLGTPSDGDLIATWPSQISGGDATQSDSSKRATWKASGQGGKPYLLFGGAQAYQWALNALTGAKSFYAILRLTSVPAASTFYLLYSAKDTTNGVFADFMAVNFAGYQPLSYLADYASAAGAMGDGFSLDTSAHMFILTYNGSGNTNPVNYTDRVDATNQSVVTSNILGRSPTDLGSIGARLDSANALTLAASMELYELAAYSQALGTSSKNLLQAYTTARYGL